MRVTKYIVIFSLAALCSCGVATRAYKSPAEDHAAFYQDEDTLSMVLAAWQDYFSDPLLRNLIGEGIDNNHDLKIAFARVRQAEANLNVARNAYFPSVSLAAETRQGWTGSNGKTLNAHSESYTLGFSTSWELDIWGKLRSAKRAQYAALLGSWEYRNLIQTSLISNIATQYYTLLALDQQLTITVRTAEVLRENVETMKALKESAIVNGAAVEQSRVLLYSTEARIPDLEFEISRVENNINLLLGRTSGAIARSTISEQAPDGSPLRDVPISFLALRPDVRQAELAFRTAFELTNVSRASLYPSLILSSGTLGYQSASLSDFFNPVNIAANVAGGLSQPLFAKRQLAANLKISKAREEEALLVFERTVVGAWQEVANISNEFQAAQRKRGIRQQQIESSARSVEYTWELLQAGVANYTEVLSAEQSLLSSELSHTNDILQELLCIVDLYRAFGGGAR